jgi:ABC-2 type transport system ATP-binding protein
VDATIEKRVRCPTCKTIMTVSGNPGETVTSTCPTCGFHGIIRFEGAPQKTGPIIRIEQLTKTFGRFTAVDHVTLTIYGGEIFGLLGPNGSGKTTTIKMLCGLLRPTSGTASILGTPIHTKAVMQQIGYMPQEIALYFDNTVHENLAFFAGIYGLTKERFIEQEERLLQFVNLERWRDALVSTLSGGMRHRLSLACALLHEPQVVFLDEPTVGVDPELRVRFWEFFHSLSQQGVTVVITTHYMDEADRCTRVGLLRQGVLIAEGNPQDLKNKMGTSSLEEAYLRLAGRQTI